MSSFSLQKDKKRKKINDLQVPVEGFHMKPHLKKHESLVEINEIILIEDKAKKQMILKQFDRTFRKLVAMVIDVTESDSTASDCMIALNEVTKVADMIRRKYEKDLKKKDFEKLLKKCWMLDQQLKQKLLTIRTNQMMQQMAINTETEERGRGR